jgi:hypothetical protein
VLFRSNLGAGKFHGSDYRKRNVSGQAAQRKASSSQKQARIFRPR